MMISRPRDTQITCSILDTHNCRCDTDCVEKKDIWHFNFFRGFTLIELLVAVAIIGVLGALLLFVLNPIEQFKKAHDAQRKNDLEQIRTVLDTYYNDNNRYPGQLSQLIGDYLPKLPKDPLNKDYCYQSDNGNSFILSTNLERSSDPQILNPKVICNNNNYNYAITSTNTSYLAFIIPIPTPIPPTPAPTLAPTPTPINIWTRKADFGGVARAGAAGFSIGNKGYIGTGYNGSFLNDFWEYDPTNDTWTQKANFGGTGRCNAVGFSIGSKGYIGTGMYMSGGTYLLNDFWEYNPTTNIWVQKAPFGGGTRYSAVGFSIGNKGYMGIGLNSACSGACNPFRGDFWEYDPTTNAWTQKADFSGGLRSGAVGFSIGNKGYLGLGLSGPWGYGKGESTFSRDFWEYDPSTNNWIQKASYTGPVRIYGLGLSIGNKGYAGTGYDFVTLTLTNDFWEYDPSTNRWTQKANFGRVGRDITGFSVGNKGYVGTGEDASYSYVKDFWEFSP